MKKTTKRAPRRLPAGEVPAKSRTLAVPRRSTNAALSRGLAAAPAPVPATGKIKLDIANATPAALMALTLTVRDGLTDNLYYGGIPATQAALASSYTAQRALADQIALAEQQLKTLKFAQQAESTNSRDILRQGARECESWDNTDEALASAGWPLRRAPGPSQVLPPPVKLTLRPTNFPGVMIARWTRVKNMRYYETQVATPDDLAASPDWTTVNSRTTTVSNDTFPRAEIGKVMYVRVRTMSAKGPSPWTDVVSAIVL